MKRGSTRVESDGPPPVMIIGPANTFIATITVITMTSSPAKRATLSDGKWPAQMPL